MLMALRNTGKFYQDGQVNEIPGSTLMASARTYVIYPGFAFVAYPNRDSTPYRARYNIPEAETVIRGTLRYQGLPEFVRTLVDLGFSAKKHKNFSRSQSGGQKQRKRL